jgi:hypothetical protein
VRVGKRTEKSGKLSVSGLVWSWNASTRASAPARSVTPSASAVVVSSRARSERSDTDVESKSVPAVRSYPPVSASLAWERDENR